MKENLKIRVSENKEWNEIQNLFFSLGAQWSSSGIRNISKGSANYLFFDKSRMSLFKHDTDIPEENDLENAIRVINNNTEITLPELRELARPKEYLNDKFELVETNQPEDGWILVPDGAEFLAEFKHGKKYFYKTSGRDCYLDVFDHWETPDKWSDTLYTSINDVKRSSELKTILWQRNPQQETTMNTEKKGRFLHQWAYEAFGRGEVIQHTSCDRDCAWTTTTIAHPISIFSVKEMQFRLKPKTIQIGERTINKPISVKPEIGTFVCIPDATHEDKYFRIKWSDSNNANLMLSRNLCHLTADDAINHCDALLELMK